MGQRKSRTKRKPKRKNDVVTADKGLRVQGLRMKDQYSLYRSLLYAYDLCKEAKVGTMEKAAKDRTLRDLETMLGLSRRVLGGIE